MKTLSRLRQTLQGQCLYLVLAAVLGMTARASAEQQRPSPQNIEQRINALLGQMTLEEKLGQLSQKSGSRDATFNPGEKAQKEHPLYVMIQSGSVGSFLNTHGAEYTNRLQRVAVEDSRLRIPLIFGNDVIHGYRTIFPIPLAEAASWDPEIVERSSRVAAIEASAAGTNWTFAPMVDICRDARWGRIAEGAGEDPYLGAAMAAARVRGFQGTDLTAPDTILACAKHFAAYGGAEAGRDYNTVDISLQTLHEVHLPPFKAAVDAGAGSFMSAFNEISGVPASGDPYLLTDVLRGQWGFDGFVVSDWESVEEMIYHGFAADEADAGVKGLSAGVDMEMASTCYRSHLGRMLEAGRIKQETIDQAVRRILRAKLRLGLFERPYADPQREQTQILCSEHRAVARESARQAIVLLRNEGEILPLSDKLESLAVIGPLADSQRDPLGTWAGRGREKDVITVLQGIRQRVGEKTKVEYVKGCEANDESRDGFAEAVKLARKCDAAVLIIGEPEWMSGEARCRTELDLPGVQRELAEAVLATGTPTVVLLMNGRPMAIPWLAEHAPAILDIWHLGVECGPAVADVLFGDYNPSGKLPATFPRRVGQAPIYYAHKSTGRPPLADDHYTSKYLDVHWTPLYPFGYGLSYTTFKYDNLHVAANRVPVGKTVEVSADVTNTGRRRGVEVAQVYVRDLVGSMTRPVRQLVGFERIELDPGETRTVRFRIESAQLGFYDRQMRFVVEPGEFAVWIGPNSAEGLEGRFAVVDEAP